MARLLYQRDSAKFMLNAIRRHQRLCRLANTASEFIAPIQTASVNLIEKLTLAEEAVRTTEDAGDSVYFFDSELDNSTRNVFRDIEKFDSNNPSQKVLTKIFPDGTFSNIIRMPYNKEPNEVEGLAIKIEALGNTHALYPLADTLKKAVAKVRTGIETHKEAIRSEMNAKAELEIIKADVVRAYEANYLDARKKYGVAYANRLFPVLTSDRKNTGDDIDNGTPDPTL